MQINNKKKVLKLTYLIDTENLERKEQHVFFQYHPLYCTQQLEVCHISVHVINRIFKDDSIMQNAYDWIGSLQEEPKFFCLMNMVEMSC